MTQPARNGAVDHVRFIPASYNTQDAFASAMQLILTVRPGWSTGDKKVDLDEGQNRAVALVKCTDGITNTLLKVIHRQPGQTKEQIEDEALLLRAYGNGTDLIIDRQRETENHELLMKYSLAPELLARFENGMLYRYIRGRVTSPEDLRRPPIYTAVARRLAQWHATVPCLPSVPAPATNGNGAARDTNSVGVVPRERGDINSIAPGKPSPNVWTVMQKWILALPTETETQRERQSLLQSELRYLVRDLSNRPGLGEHGLVFAHCDLLSGNVIIRPAKDGADESTAPVVSFIDYEYATPSPAAFDIANHFAEWGGFDCDYSVLPTQSQRQEFIREYVHAYFELLPTAQPGVDEDAETRKLMDEVDMFRGVPGFYWGIWSLIQAVISEIDFDYASYAEVRLGEYWAWKAEADGSRQQAGGDLSLRERRWAQEQGC